VHELGSAWRFRVVQTRQVALSRRSILDFTFLRFITFRRRSEMSALAGWYRVSARHHPVMLCDMRDRSTSPKCDTVRNGIPRVGPCLTLAATVRDATSLKPISITKQPRTLTPSRLAISIDLISTAGIGSHCDGARLYSTIVPGTITMLAILRTDSAHEHGTGRFHK
jgi:hypothetical protein